MKIKFWNLQKIIIGIVFGEIIGVSLCVRELIKVNRIEESGIESKVYAQYEYDKDSKNGYYNYYFQVNNNKIWITKNINKKQIEIEKKIYWNKKVKYNPVNPKEFVLINEDNQLQINIIYYFFTLPLLLAVFYTVIFPDKLHKKLCNNCFRLPPLVLV